MRVWLAALPPFSHKLKICGSPIAQGGLQDFSLHTQIIRGNKQTKYHLITLAHAMMWGMGVLFYQTILLQILNK